MNAKTLILAAGSSSRLGKKKQLLTFKGSTLLNRAISIAESCLLGDIYVVLGFGANEIQESIENSAVHIVLHPLWENGMGSSLAKGIQELPSDASGVYILLTDQVKLSHEFLQAFKKKVLENPESIICSRYHDNFGAPTYFPSSHFDALSKCKGASGAKKYIKEHLSEVKMIDFLGGEIDIDVPSDLGILEE